MLKIDQKQCRTLVIVAIALCLAMAPLSPAWAGSKKNKKKKKKNKPTPVAVEPAYQSITSKSIAEINWQGSTATIVENKKGNRVLQNTGRGFTIPGTGGRGGYTAGYNGAGYSGIVNLGDLGILPSASRDNHTFNFYQHVEKTPYRDSGLVFDPPSQEPASQTSLTQTLSVDAQSKARYSRTNATASLNTGLHSFNGRHGSHKDLNRFAEVLIKERGERTTKHIANASGAARLFVGSTDTQNKYDITGYSSAYVDSHKKARMTSSSVAAQSGDTASYNLDRTQIVFFDVDVTLTNDAEVTFELINKKNNANALSWNTKELGNGTHRMQFATAMENSTDSPNDYELRVNSISSQSLNTRQKTVTNQFSEAEYYVFLSFVEPNNYKPEQWTFHPPTWTDINGNKHTAPSKVKKTDPYSYTPYGPSKIKYQIIEEDKRVIDMTPDVDRPETPKSLLPFNPDTLGTDDYEGDQMLVDFVRNQLPANLQGARLTRHGGRDLLYFESSGNSPITFSPEKDQALLQAFHDAYDQYTQTTDPDDIERSSRPISVFNQALREASLDQAKLQFGQLRQSFSDMGVLDAAIDQILGTQDNREYYFNDVSRHDAPYKHDDLAYEDLLNATSLDELVELISMLNEQNDSTYRPVNVTSDTAQDTSDALGYVYAFEITDTIADFWEPIVTDYTPGYWEISQEEYIPTAEEALTDYLGQPYPVERHNKGINFTFDEWDKSDGSLNDMPINSLALDADLSVEFNDDPLRVEQQDLISNVLQNVPEPGSLALLSFGLFAINRRSWAR